MTNRVLLIASLVTLALAAAPTAPSRAQTQAQEKLADVVFSEIEKRVIRDFFGIKGNEAKKGKGKGKSKAKGDLPPGLAKRDTLPPGLEMQLQRNGRLPPGLEKRSLPPELESRLKKRAGYDRLIVNNDVMLVQRATGLIMDILKGVIVR